jgi:two-component system, NtrC family, nitrogen regulation sensor histidine kinase NtrY
MPPKRFRRRLVAVMLVAGLLPVLVWAAASWVLADRVLGLSLEPLQELFDRVDDQLAKDPSAAPLVADLTDARRKLANVELGRRGLLRLAPWGYLGVVVVSGALLIAAALVLARAVSTRIERLTETVGHYARGDLAHRTSERSAISDEIDLLVRQFNEMGAQLEAQRQRLATTEAVAAWQDVARTLAHDLKNPLTAMRLSVGRLARAGEVVDALQGEIDVLLRMTESFAAFAKLPPPVPKQLDLRALLDEVIAVYGQPIAVTGAAALPIRADADQLRRALGNLVKNAFEASPAGAPPVEVTLVLDGDDAVVSISDHGTGVAEPLEGRRLLTTLGTTKPGGSGQGLPIAAKIIHDHAGSLRLEPVEGGGARAVVRLPRGTA